jgi:1-deoxy-D-xylulose-5-phosphate synthase
MYKFLSQIQSPEDLKDLTPEECQVLAYEIRKFLVTSVAQTGGHLASNLGVVELTMALHKVFNSPEDQILWDVGHQGYVHKLLTGRMADFPTLRQYGGLSGFLKRSESEHDRFEMGHSSTSVSAGIGLAIARDQSGKSGEVISVIGDGALTGGMALEAMNFLGHSGLNMKVILNDNAMSISKNVGGLSTALNRIRTHNAYSELKDKTKSGLSKLPTLGSPTVNFISRFKESLKYFLVNGSVFFETLGFTYIGPVDGHDIQALTEHLEMIKHVEGPVILHVHTQKGKGYAFAEENPKLYHGVGKFDPSKPIEEKPKKDYSAVVGDCLSEMAAKDDEIVAISAAMIEGTGLSGFAERYPDRIFDVGIAEQNAVTMAAGMAAGGLKPFVAIYSTFLQRAYDQILHDVCMQNLPVVFCLDRAGLVGNDGETHHGVFDLSYLRTMPNMTVLSPKDDAELRWMLQYAADNSDGPIAIRYPRGKAEPFGSVPGNSLIPETLSGGTDALIFATGKMVRTAIDAAERLKESDISVEVINVRRIKPLDAHEVSSAVSRHRIIFTLEDNSVVGGLGDAVLAAAAESGMTAERKIIKLGIPDAFVHQGDTDVLMRVLKLDAEGVAAHIAEVIHG